MITSKCHAPACGRPENNCPGLSPLAGNNGGRDCRNLLACAACGVTGTVFRIVRGLDRTLGGCGCRR